MKNLNLFIIALVLLSFSTIDVSGQWTQGTTLDEYYFNPTTARLGVGTTNPNNFYRFSVEAGDKMGLYVAASSKRAIYARSVSNTALYASSSSGTGVYGTSTNGTGVEGRSWTGRSVYGGTSTGYGIYGRATSSSGFAGYFEGNVEVEDKMTVGTSNAPTSIGGEDISHYHLFVQGGILADEVRVRNNWADYVFDKGYDLKPLYVVQQHIKANGHLPNVPSEKEVLDRGLDIGEMTKIQQEKIEELFLYVIEMDKKIRDLEEENERLTKELEGLKK